MKNKNILVIGDVILDEYTYGKKMGVSAETPTVVAEYDRTERFVGGAGLVVRHLLRLGATVTLLTVGSISEEESLFSRFLKSEDPLSKEECARLTLWDYEESGWSYTQKRRFYVDEYKMVQYDVVNRGQYTAQLREFVNNALSFYEKFDVVLVCDNRHGVIDENLQKSISLLNYETHMSGRSRPKLFVDSQVSQSLSNHAGYSGSDVIFLNLRELESIVGPPLYGDCIVDRVATARDMLSSGIILKLGSLGSAAMFRGSDEYIETEPYHPEKVRDTCGAGDAFLAAYAVTEDLEFANRWAGLSTSYCGTIVPESKCLS